MMNPAKLLTMKKEWEAFERRHPKFVQFIMLLVRSGMGAGAVIDISVTLPDGTALQSNMRVSEEDVAFFNNIKDIM